MKYLLPILVLTLLSSCEQPPDVIHQGGETVVEEWKLAKKGDIVSQFGLANRFKTGDGVTKNLPEAAKWYTMIVNREHSESESGIVGSTLKYLASMHARGEGVPMDYKEAERLYILGDPEGTGEGHFNIGKMYLWDGNYEKSIIHLKKAHANGFLDASMQLGFLYSGVPEFGGSKSHCDPQLAESWFYIANMDGHRTHTVNVVLALMYDRLGRDESYVKNHPKAFDHYLKSANLGSVVAQKEVAGMYFFGKGIRMDRVQACKWYFVSKQNGAANYHDYIIKESNPKDVEAGENLAKIMIKQNPDLIFRK